MSTFALRQKLVEIARRNVGKTEVSKNRADWIKQLWPATSYPAGYAEREKYCAAGMAWALREWLKLPEVLAAFGFTAEQAEAWRCKSASCYRDTKSSWAAWAKKKGLQILGKDDEFHAGDLIIYTFSHIEMYVDDLPGKKFTAIGYNTDGAGSRDGDGCFEKPRSREKIKLVIRLLA